MFDPVFDARARKSQLEFMTGSPDVEARRLRRAMIRETYEQQQRQNIPVINTPRVSPEQINNEIKLFNEKVLAKQDVTNALLARQFDTADVGELVELFGEQPPKKSRY